jgi:hypothetical protein
MLGFNWLDFFFPLDLVEEGGGASLSGLAYALVASGATTSAVENIASVKILANFLMHLSC